MGIYNIINYKIKRMSKNPNQTETNCACAGGRTCTCDLIFMSDML